MKKLTPAEQQQIAETYTAVRGRIERDGSETMRVLLRQTEELLTRNPDWTECQRTSRRREILRLWAAEHSATPPVENAPTRVPDNPEPVDLVIPLSKASKDGRDNEIRYLLRSAQANIPGLRKVWILGTHRPAWLTGVEFVDVPDDQRRKSWNILRKFRALAEQDTTERMIKASDDTVFLSPVGVKSWTVVKGRQLRQVMEGRRASFWTRCQHRTREWLAGHGYGTVNYDTHAPCVLSKTGLERMFAEFGEDEWKQGRGWALWSLFYNITPPTSGEVCLCRRVKATFERGSKSESIDEVRRRCKGKLFAGYNNPGLTDQLLAYFQERFPDPSRFELSDELLDELSPQVSGPARTFTWRRPPVELPETGLEDILGDRVHEDPPQAVLAAVAKACQRPMVVTDREHADEFREAFPEGTVEVAASASAAAVLAQIRLRRKHRRKIAEVVLGVPMCGPAVRKGLQRARCAVYDLHDALWRRPEPPPVPPGLPNVSFIVPIRNLQADPDRMASFEFVIARILEAKPGEVIIVEQARPGQEPLPVPDGCRSVVIESTEDGIEKSRLLNAAAQEATGAILWIQDADCWLAFSDVASRIDAGTPAAKPFGEVWRLDAEQTAEFTANGSVVCPRPRAISNNWGGGSLIIRQAEFIRIRGYDESFIGWGGEDNEFGDRVRQNTAAKEFTDVVCLHMWHPRNRGELLRASDGARKLKEARALSPADRIAAVVSPFPPPAPSPEPPQEPTVAADQPPRMPPIELKPGTAETCDRDTVMIIPFYPPANTAEREVRSRALHRTVERILSTQRDLPTIVIAELVNRTAHAADIVHPKVVYYPMAVDERNAALMHKEAVINEVLAQLLLGHVVVSDDDIWSPDPLWLAGIVDRISSGMIVHGFGWIADTRSDCWWWGYGRWQQQAAKGTVAKGGTYGFARQVWSDLGGLNPWAIAGGGDALFLLEAVEGDHTKDVRGFREHQSIDSVFRPGLPKSSLTYCPAVVYHEHHGDHKQRAYAGRMNLMDRFGAAPEYVRLNARGLLEWKRPGCLLHRCLERRSELQSTEDVERIMLEEMRKGAVI